MKSEPVEAREREQNTAARGAAREQNVEARGSAREQTMDARAHGLYALRWCFLCALTCLLLISFDNWAATGFVPRMWAEPFYNARIALYTGLSVGGVWALLYAIEHTVFARAPLLVGGLVLMAVSPLVSDTAAQLATGEGFVALHIPQAVVQQGARVVLYGFVAFVWWYSRADATRSLHALFGSVAVCAMAVFEQRLMRTYGMLAPFLLVGLLVTTTSVIAHLLAASDIASGLITRMGSGILLAFVLVGVIMPGWVAAGRRAVLADETAVLNVDALFFAAETSAVRFDISHPERFHCDELPHVNPWPALNLPAEKRRNVILVSVDALREDRLGRRVYGQHLMRNVERFARDATLVRHAYTSYPATLFALGSAMTGLMPSEILFSPTPPDTLFRLATIKIPLETAVVPASEWFVLPAFASYVAQDLPRRVRADAAEETDEAIKFLEEARASGEPHLLWIHYLEPHAPYVRHPEFDFGDAPEDRYDSEVAAFDAEFGRLLDFLRNGGWYDDSLIMFFADHGQALGERGYFGHHVFLHRFISDIPFVFRVPDSAPGSIEEPVSIADVAPTVLHFLDIMPKRALSGQSLLGAGPRKDRAVLSEAFPMRGTSLFEFADTKLTSATMLSERIQRIQQGDRRYHPKVAIVQNGERLIVRRTTGTTELYALEDVREANEQTETHPKVVARLMQDLAGWHRKASERFFCDVHALHQADKPKQAPAAGAEASIKPP